MPSQGKVRRVAPKRGTKRKVPNKEKRAQNLLSKRAPMGAHIFLPKRKRVTMRYVDYVQLDGTGAVGGNVSHIYRANSIYDPDQTGTGHQPMGHDLYAGLYEHYSVVRSAIKCTFYMDGNLLVPVIIRVRGDSDTVVSSTWQAECEESNPFEYGLLPEEPAERYKTLVIKQEYDRDAIYKQGSDLHSGTNASFGANPAEGYYFKIMAINADSSATNWGSTISCLVELVYEVDCTEPADQTQN